MEYKAKILWGMSLEAIDTEMGEIAKAEYGGKAVDRPHMWDLLETKKRYLAAQARLNEQQHRNNRFTEITTETIYNEIRNEEEKTMSSTFAIIDTTYSTNKTGNRFFKTEDGKKTRISHREYDEAKATYEQLMTEEQTTETAPEQERLTTKDEGVWQYLTLRRPPMPGGIPAGAIEVGEFDDPFVVMGVGTARGWATYDRELTEQELADHEMVPMVTDDKGTAEKQQTDKEWEAEAEAERKAREDKIAADAKATEDAVNGIMATLTEKAEEKPEKGKKKAKKEKTGKKDQPKAETKEKAKKTRKSKDIAHEHKDGEVTITLTAKQVDFVLHLSDSCFWERGLDSVLWCDVLCDEIGGQFEGKPMTIGAMVSTLCEKGLAIRTKDRLTDATTGKSRKGTTFQLTEKGKEIAKELGLK